MHEHRPPRENSLEPEQGKIGYAIAWLLGVPIPILLIVWLFTRC